MPRLPIRFFFNDTATTEIYTLSLHDALPICLRDPACPTSAWCAFWTRLSSTCWICTSSPRTGRVVAISRSEEHTSELQSHLNLVCRLLLEKKNCLPYTHLRRRAKRSTLDLQR